MHSDLAMLWLKSYSKGQPPHRTGRDEFYRHRHAGWFGALARGLIVVRPRANSVSSRKDNRPKRLRSRVPQAMRARNHSCNRQECDDGHRRFPDDLVLLHGHSHAMSHQGGGCHDQDLSRCARFLRSYRVRLIRDRRMGRGPVGGREARVMHRRRHAVLLQQDWQQRQDRGLLARAQAAAHR
jgi:hypothetical protein